MIQLFLSGPFIVFKNVSGSGIKYYFFVLFLRRGLMDGLEARLVSCWTRCFNLAERFIVVKAALVLSRKKVLG